MRKLLLLPLFLILAPASQADEQANLATADLAEIDRKLNNPLTSLWSLTFQNNASAKEGDRIDGTEYSNTLFFQPFLPFEVGDRLTLPIGLGITKTTRWGKTPVKLRAEIHYSIVRPEDYGTTWNFRLQVTPVIKNPLR